MNDSIKIPVGYMSHQSWNKQMKVIRTLNFQKQMEHSCKSISDTDSRNHR